MGVTKIRPKRFLKRLYIKQGIPAARIAEMLDVHRVTIREWLVKYNIPIRQKNDYRHKPYGHKIPSKEELTYWYKTRKVSRDKLGEKFGVTGRAMHNWLASYNLTRHYTPPSAEELYYWFEEYKKDAKLLKEVYQKIADKYGVHKRTVFKWFEKYRNSENS